MRTWVYVAGVGVVAAAGVAAYLALRPSPQAQLDDQWAMLGKYCTDCHNDAELTGELSFERRSSDSIHTDPAIWEKVVHKLSIGAMPPRDQPQPDANSRARFVAALTGTLDAAAAAKPYAGATTVHRLNRAEYANAIRDLVGVEADLSELLPSDGGDFGFDNIADVLTTSPLLLERYLTVALRVADMAIGNPDAALTATSYRIPFELTQNKHLEGMPLGTRGGTKVNHTFPADGDYVFSGRLVRGVEEGLFGVEGHDRPHEFLVLVDGKIVHSSEIGGKEDHEVSVAEGFNSAQFSIDERLTSPPIPITAGSARGGFHLERADQRASRTRGSRVCERRWRSTTRRACRGSRTWSSKALRTSPASARRRAASASSFAVPPPRLKSPRARARFCRRLRDAHFAGRLPATTSRRRSPSTTRLGQTAATSTRASAQPSPACS